MRHSLVAILCVLTAGCGQKARPDVAAGAPPTAFDGALVTEAAARVEHGKRLASVLGCTGCHGDDLQGHWFYRLQSANLTRDVHKYNDSDLERLLREGKRIGGRELWSMPSEIFQHMSEPDMGALIAYLRTLKPAGKPTPPLPPLTAKDRKDIAAGELKPAPEWVKVHRATTPVDLGPEHALGRYITMVTCAECHNAALQGWEGDTPDLIVAGVYSRDEFETLMTRGVPNGPRKLDLMANVAKRRFSKMTRHERDALYAYLKARAERPQP